VLKGLHGFHIYATQYWTEYLVSHAASLGSMDKKSDLLALAIDLAQKLDQMLDSPLGENSESDIMISDDSLTMLNQHPLLRKHVIIAHKARSLHRLEAELYGQSG
jgi:hypothetical protein